MHAWLPSELVSVAGAAAAIAINALWEGALIVACVWLLVRAWPRINAATRYIIWSATLLAVAVVPVATTLPFLASSRPIVAATPAVRAPTEKLGVTHALTAATPVIKHAGATKESSATAAVPPSGTVSSTAAAPSPAPRLHFALPLSLALGVLAMWLALAVFAIVRLIIGLLRLEQLKRDALPLPIEYREAMARWIAVNKGSREVRLCVSDEIDVPVAVGLFDAMILIPRSLLDRLSETEVDQISLHELAHLRRADDWSNGLQRIVIALFGWNPAVAFVGTQLDLEREVACDDWVLSLTGMVRPYALCLTKMAETSSWPHHPVPAPGVFTTRKHISMRIERLLGAGRNIATTLSIGPAAATVAVVGALAFAITLVAPSIAAPATDASGTTASATAASAVKPDHVKLVFVREEKSTVAEKATAAPATAAPAAPAATSKPAQSANAHSSTIHVPATHVHVPEMTVHVPKTEVNIPEMTIPLPSMPANLPPQARTGVATGMGIAQSISHAFASSARTVAQSVSSCSSCNFAHVDWSGRDMHGANYTGSDFTGATLRGTNFSGGNFNGVDFSHADLRGASFRGANLTGVDFTGAQLTNVDFTGAKMNGGDFSHANIGPGQLRSILNTCRGCDFSGSNLAGADLSNVDAQGDDFSHADLNGANMSHSHFTGIDFTGASFSGANLSGSVINGCDMSGVDLSHVDLSNTKLIGVDMSGKEPEK
jgi:uncharacterized protein YjbI with pentapeptide repeats/beta-lactamase regulating signal transducer with metallopeptidase domain